MKEEIKRKAGQRRQVPCHKDLKDLQLTDHFLFGEVMHDTEICKMVLEIILGRKVSAIKTFGREQWMEAHPSYKGVRLDVCFADEEETAYSIEIQNTNRYNIPRRSRHYQSMIDVKIMPKGEIDYNCLSDSIVIFICSFDLFGYGRYCYTFENLCLEEAGLSLGDGSRKIFLNTKGSNEAETSSDLVDFLRCVENTNEIRTDNEKICRILKRVKTVKNDAEVEGRYMTTEQWMNEMRYEIREEVREEVKEEIREEVLEEGKEKEAHRYGALTIVLLAQKRYGDLERAAKDKVFRERMYRQFEIQ